MHAQQALPEAPPAFGFEHTPSEINYGGPHRFHQAAFPPTEADTLCFEERVFQVIRSLVRLTQEGSANAPLPAWKDPLIETCFFDLWCQAPRLSPQAFQRWVSQEVEPLAQAFQRLHQHALRQEREAALPRLNLWVCIAAVTCVADVLREYFEKNIALETGLAWVLRMTLGRILAWALTRAEFHPELARVRHERLGTTEPDPDVLRLLNPWSLAWVGDPEELTPEQCLHGLNPYRLAYKQHVTWSAFFEDFFKSGRVYTCLRPERSLAEPQAWTLLWGHPRETTRLVRALRRERAFREQWLMESVCEHLRQWFRRHVGVTAENGFQAALGGDRFWEDLLHQPTVRRRWLRTLSKKNHALAREARQVVREGVQRLRQGRRQWWGRLSREALILAAQEALERWRRWLAESRDFHQLRSAYAHTGHAGVGWIGIKLWRGTELAYNPSPGEAHDRLICTPIWTRLQSDMDNAFTEGNLFLCRSVGEIYPGEQTRRHRSAFLFADLRNSTETTMKLTKDTASYLTPYLTAVDTEAQACQGERIYFAGDGYAAHYARAMDAIRAAYNLTGRFIQLRAQSTDEQRKKIKSLYMELKALDLPWQKPGQLEKRLAEKEPSALSHEGAALLKDIVNTHAEVLTEEGLMKLLMRVASEFCMPRVDVGVGLTCGELFLAMVGAGDRPKYPIVISPALTQAARLSGSSDLVKKYIEEHLLQPFAYNAYAWDKKLFNRGIVISDEVYALLNSEVHIKEVVHKEKKFENEKFMYYYDTQLNKRLILRDIQETVALKGISKPCHLFEVILPYSVIDKLFGSSEE